jgi:hypothetical protein
MPICDMPLLVTIEERIQGVISLEFSIALVDFLRSCLEKKITDYSFFNRGYRKIILFTHEIGVFLNNRIVVCNCLCFFSSHLCLDFRGLKRCWMWAFCLFLYYNCRGLLFPDFVQFSELLFLSRSYPTLFYLS